MTFFIQLTKKLRKYIPIEVIDEILKNISIENLFRLGIDEEKLNYLAEYITFENILEHPEIYEEYNYDIKVYFGIGQNLKILNST